MSPVACLSDGVVCVVNAVTPGGRLYYVVVCRDLLCVDGCWCCVFGVVMLIFVKRPSGMASLVASICFGFFHHCNTSRIICGVCCILFCISCD